MLTQAEGARVHACFQAHLALARAAVELAVEIDRRAPEQSDLLRLGAACIHLSAQRALAARDSMVAHRAWNECDPGERQIRLATYRLFVALVIPVARYDALFQTASVAARTRREEQLKLRRELRACCSL